MVQAIMLTSQPASATAHVPLCAPDGEPLCLAPAPGELCETARRRLPEVESDLRRRLSGPDRSIEAIELEALVSGFRPAPHNPAISANGNGIHRAASPDPLLESGVLCMCAAQLLGRPSMVHLAEGLALRGLKVSRGTLASDQPPRALDAVGLLHRTGHAAPFDRRERDQIDLYRAAPDSPAARALSALSAAGLSRPLILVVHPSQGQGQGQGMTSTTSAPTFDHAGLGALPGDLRAAVVRAFAPHTAADATRPAQALLDALPGRNPWLIQRMSEVTWPFAWPESHRLTLPQLTSEGAALSRQVLGRNPDPDESFALACLALAAAVRLTDLQAEPHPAPAPVSAGADVDQTLHPGPENEQAHLLAALSRLLSRPLLPAQDGEAPLFLQAALRAGTFVLDARNPDEMGRLLTTVGTGSYARLRLFRFQKEVPHGLSVVVRHGDDESLSSRPVAWFVDGGDLRVHIELVHGGSLLRGLS